jgi:hypothetical protein
MYRTEGSEPSVIELPLSIHVRSRKKEGQVRRNACTGQEKKKRPRGLNFIELPAQ